MKSEIILSTKTGNTLLLANEIVKKTQGEIYSIQEARGEGDVLFLGFWVNQGSCNEEMSEFLKGIHHKQVVLFGTMGTGDNDDYHQLVTQNALKAVPEDNTVLGVFLCQGKMPASTRQRYEKMVENDPRNIHMQMMLKNFDKVLTHPDANDLVAFNKFLNQVLENI